MHWDAKKHPRHTENGRFRDKAGAPELTAYARRIEAKIASSRGEAPKKAAPKKTGGVRPRAGTFIGNVSATHGNARPVTHSKATINRAEDAHQLVLGMRGSSKAEIDKELHSALGAVSVQRLRAMRDHLMSTKSEGMYRGVTADSIARLIAKKTGG